MAELKEEEYVHKVYNEIANHFSETRYKPWPIVIDFLNKRNVGSIGIDVGCGNGKYLHVNPNVFIIGSDRSSGLVECANEIDNSHNVLIADGMNLPHNDNTFDFAISIAVVHHWATRERRIAAIRHILSKLRAGGEAMIYCWALEQRSSRRGYHEGMEQDILVPWVLQEKRKKSNLNGKKKVTMPDLTGIPPHLREQHIANWRKEQEQKRSKEQATPYPEGIKAEENNTKYRYYHLYRDGELEEDSTRAGGIVTNKGYEKDNWYVIVQKPKLKSLPNDC